MVIRLKVKKKILYLRVAQVLQGARWLHRERMVLLHHGRKPLERPDLTPRPTRSFTSALVAVRLSHKSIQVVILSIQVTFEWTQTRTIRSLSPRPSLCGSYGSRRS